VLKSNRPCRVINVHEPLEVIKWIEQTGGSIDMQSRQCSLGGVERQE
jgi:hypothetical protein